MGNIFKLIDKTANAKQWGPSDVVEALQSDINDGKVPQGARMLVVYTGPQSSGRFDTSFLQCGMSASEMIMLLEIAKQDIYKNQMCT